MLSLGLHAKQPLTPEETENIAFLEENISDLKEAAGNVKEDLEKLAPEKIKEDADREKLLDSFHGILKFIEHINKRLAQLMNEDDLVDQAEIAKLALECAEAQEAVEKMEVKLTLKHKKRHEKIIQSIKDQLFQAEQSLQNIIKKAEDALHITKNTIQSHFNDIADKIKKKAKATKQAVKKQAKKLSEKLANFSNNVSSDDDNSDDSDNDENSADEDNDIDSDASESME